MVGAPPAFISFVIRTCFLAFVALLLLGSIGAFFLCFPVLPTALVAVILVGMAALFLLGFWVGNTGSLSAWLRQRLENRSRASGPQAEGAVHNL